MNYLSGAIFTQILIGQDESLVIYQFMKVVLLKIKQFITPQVNFFGISQ